MKSATLADAAIMNAELLYDEIEQLRAKIENLQTENQLLNVLIGN